MYRPGEVLLLRFPFTNGTGVKRRPALVLVDVGDADIIVARVTSRQVASPYDVAVSEWQQAGLLLPSIVRVHKIATVSKQLVDRTLGRLSQRDMERVRSVLHDLCVSF